MNPTILLPQLIKDLQGKVEFAERNFQSKEQVLELEENIIINCTGLGAKELFNDHQVRGLRGHLAVLQRTKARQFYFLSGGCSPEEISYVFCRQNDIVIGGSALPANHDSLALNLADQAQCSNVLAKAHNFLKGDLAACNNLMELAHRRWDQSGS